MFSKKLRQSARRPEGCADATKSAFPPNFPYPRNMFFGPRKFSLQGQLMHGWADCRAKGLATVVRAAGRRILSTRRMSSRHAAALRLASMKITQRPYFDILTLSKYSALYFGCSSIMADSCISASISWSYFMRSPERSFISATTPRLDLTNFSPSLKISCWSFLSPSETLLSIESFNILVLGRIGCSA